MYTLSVMKSEVLRWTVRPSRLRCNACSHRLSKRPCTPVVHAQGQEFVWSNDSNEYAILESPAKVKLYKNFQVRGHAHPACWLRRCVCKCVGG